MIKELLKKEGAVKHFARFSFQENKELQDIVDLAAQICNCPIALITLMDGEEQLIRVKVGTDAERNSREYSFCQYLNGPDELLIVPNALEDERFKDNPLVAGETHIRFYAGAALCTDEGEVLGSLCVLDQQVQQLDADQKRMLSILSRQAYRLMELEVNNQLLKQHAITLEKQKLEISDTATKLRAIFESSPDCFILLDKDFNILAFNKSLEEFAKKVAGKTVKTGLNLKDVVSESTYATYFRNCSRALIKRKTTAEIKVNYEDKQQIWWRIDFTPAYDCSGNIIGVTINARDVTENKLFSEKVIQQNKVLRKIAFFQSHEVRRPLANIIGLISLLKLRQPKDEIYQRLEVSALALDQQLRDSIKNVADTHIEKSAFSGDKGNYLSELGVAVLGLLLLF